MADRAGHPGPADREPRAQHDRSLQEYLAERDAADRAIADGKAVQGVDDFSLAVLDLGIGYEQAVIDWVDNLPKHVKDGSGARQD